MRTTTLDLAMTTRPDQSRLARAFRSTAVGLGVGAACGLIAFFFVAIPFLMVARFESNGLGRPLIQTGLFRVAVAAGLVVGLASGVAAAWWRYRGHSWTVPGGSASVGGDQFHGR